MLIALATIALGAGYYQFVYKTQVAEVEELANRKQELQQEYDSVIQTIRTL